MRLRLVSPALIYLLLSCASSFQLQPQHLGSGQVWWGSFRYDSLNTAKLDSDSNYPSGLLWEFKSGTPLTTTPLIRGNAAILACGDKKVYILNTRTGKKLGQLSLPGPAIATPALSGNVIYVGAGKNTKKLLAINYLSGAAIWERKLGEVTNSPVVSGNRLLVGTGEGTLFCLDKQNGSELWTFKSSEPIVSTPAVQGNRLYFGSLDGNLYCPRAKRSGDTRPRQEYIPRQP